MISTNNLYYKLFLSIILVLISYILILSFISFIIVVLTILTNMILRILDKYFKIQVPSFVTLGFKNLIKFKIISHFSKSLLTFYQRFLKSSKITLIISLGGVYFLSAPYRFVIFYLNKCLKKIFSFFYKFLFLKIIRQVGKLTRLNSKKLDEKFQQTISFITQTEFKLKSYGIFYLFLKWLKSTLFCIYKACFSKAQIVQLTLPKELMDEVNTLYYKTTGKVKIIEHNSVISLKNPFFSFCLKETLKNLNEDVKTMELQKIDKILNGTVLDGVFSSSHIYLRIKEVNYAEAILSLVSHPIIQQWHLEIQQNASIMESRQKTLISKNGIKILIIFLKLIRTSLYICIQTLYEKYRKALYLTFPSLSIISYINYLNSNINPQFQNKRIPLIDFFKSSKLLFNGTINNTSIDNIYIVPPSWLPEPLQSSNTSYYQVFSGIFKEKDLGDSLKDDLKEILAIIERMVKKLLDEGYSYDEIINMMKKFIKILAEIFISDIVYIGITFFLLMTFFFKILSHFRDLGEEFRDQNSYDRNPYVQEQPPFKDLGKVLEHNQRFREIVLSKRKRIYTILTGPLLSGDDRKLSLNHDKSNRHLDAYDQIRSLRKGRFLKWKASKPNSFTNPLTPHTAASEIYEVWTKDYPKSVFSQPSMYHNNRPSSVFRAGISQKVLNKFVEKKLLQNVSPSIEAANNLSKKKINDYLPYSFFHKNLKLIHFNKNERHPNITDNDLTKIDQYKKYSVKINNVYDSISKNNTIFSQLTQTAASMAHGSFNAFNDILSLQLRGRPFDNDDIRGYGPREKFWVISENREKAEVLDENNTWHWGPWQYGHRRPVIYNKQRVRRFKGKYDHHRVMRMVEKGYLVSLSTTIVVDHWQPMRWVPKLLSLTSEYIGSAFEMVGLKTPSTLIRLEASNPSYKKELSACLMAGAILIPLSTNSYIRLITLGSSTETAFIGLDCFPDLFCEKFDKDKTESLITLFDSYDRYKTSKKLINNESCPPYGVRDSRFCYPFNEYTVQQPSRFGFHQCAGRTYSHDQKKAFDYLDTVVRNKLSKRIVSCYIVDPLLDFEQIKTVRDILHKNGLENITHLFLAKGKGVTKFIRPTETILPDRVEYIWGLKNMYNLAYKDPKTGLLTPCPHYDAFSLLSSFSLGNVVTYLEFGFGTKQSDEFLNRQTKHVYLPNENTSGVKVASQHLSTNVAFTAVNLLISRDALKLIYYTSLRLFGSLNMKDYTNKMVNVFTTKKSNTNDANEKEVNKVIKKDQDTQCNTKINHKKK